MKQKYFPCVNLLKQIQVISCVVFAKMSNSDLVPMWQGIVWSLMHPWHLKKKEFDEVMVKE